MKDFDFEELDRAVSGVLGSAPIPSTPTTPPSTKTVPNDAPSKPVSILPTPTSFTTPELVSDPVTDTPSLSDAPVDLPSESSPTVAPAARRTSGRFMDMVHPSSDMRSQTTGVPSPAPSSPAPRAVNAFDELENAPVIDLSTPVPQESPFLPDAKVDKRPLGGSEPTGSFVGVTNDPDPVDSAKEPVDLDVMPDPIDFAQSSDVQEETLDDESLEADELPNELRNFSDTEPKAEALDLDEAEEKPLELESLNDEEQVASDIASLEHETAPELTKIEDEPVAFVPQPKKQDIPEEPTGPVSITQQYTEQPSATPQESGAIYDTESYHQPLTKPVKKKSGLWAIVWIIGLIALGAAAGVAIYLYVLPML